MRRSLEPVARAIFLTGFMGTGKSTVGWRLAQRLGLPLVDTDDLVEERAGMTIPEVFSRYGEEYFRDLESDALKEALRGERAVISTGGGILLRAENVGAMRAAGPIICLEASPETIVRRTAHNNDRPLLNAERSIERVRELMGARAGAYAQADYHISTDHDDQERTVTEALRLLRGDPRAVYLVARSLRVKVELGPDSYIVAVGSGQLGALGELYPPQAPGTRCVIVTSDVIRPLFADRASAGLSAGGWRVDVLTVPDGEASKSWEVAGQLLNGLARLHIDRGATLFALGGGVVGDLAGFVASVYLRGIDVVQIPTSLLAQVDSSVGGKVAVDLPQAKNLVGSFHQPKAVFIDTDTLETLPDRELRAGLAEVIKHGIISDEVLFNYLEQNSQAVLARDALALRYCIARSCQIKAQVVEQDPRDRGARHLLNFGHTIGHAIERAAANWDMRHGEAVAVGMVGAMRVAARLELVDRADVRRVEAVIEAYGLPTRVPDLDPEVIRAALSRDKKVVRGELSMPLVSKIGSARVYRGIAFSHLEAVVEELIE